MDKYTLILQNNVSKSITYINNLGVAEASKLYLAFNITIEDNMDDGEYNYYLVKNTDNKTLHLDNNEVKDEDGNIYPIMSNGLLFIGDFENQSKKYTPSKPIFKQYK